MHNKTKSKYIIHFLIFISLIIYTIIITKSTLTDMNYRINKKSQLKEHIKNPFPQAPGTIPTTKNKKTQTLITLLKKETNTSVAIITTLLSIPFIILTIILNNLTTINKNKKYNTQNHQKEIHILEKLSSETTRVTEIDPNTDHVIIIRN